MKHIVKHLLALTLIFSGCGKTRDESYQTQSVVLVKPAGKIAYIYKHSGMIYIRNCKDYTIVNTTNDCDGFISKSFTIDEFKKKLTKKLYSRFSVNLSEEYQRYLMDYINASTSLNSEVENLNNLRMKLENLISIITPTADELERLDRFASTFGLEQIDQEKLESLRLLVEELTVETEALTTVVQDKTTLVNKLKSSQTLLNNLISKLVDDFISSDRINTIKVSNTSETQFFYAILFDEM